MFLPDLCPGSSSARTAEWVYSNNLEAEHEDVPDSDSNPQLPSDSESDSVLPKNRTEPSGQMISEIPTPIDFDSVDTNCSPRTLTYYPAIQHYTKDVSVTELSERPPVPATSPPAPQPVQVKSLPLEPGSECQRKDSRTHELLPQCSSSCRLKCRGRFTEEERKATWGTFWNLDSAAREKFIIDRMTGSNVERRTVFVDGCTKATRRNTSYKYNLNEKRVCKTMFLHTLGKLTYLMLNNLIDDILCHQFKGYHTY